MGNKGDDILYGGADADGFYFQDGDGDDVVKDFDLAADKLYFISNTYTQFSDFFIANNASGDAVVNYGTSSVTIEGVDASEIDASHFLYSGGGGASASMAAEDGDGAFDAAMAVEVGIAPAPSLRNAVLANSYTDAVDVDYLLQLHDGFRAGLGNPGGGNPGGGNPGGGNPGGGNPGGGNPGGGNPGGGNPGGGNPGGGNPKNASQLGDLATLSSDSDGFVLAGG